MDGDLWQLYELMLRSRLFEREVSRLWERGLISGEMHLGVGEEAICAGTVAQLIDGDALALDHRATPVLLMRGVNPVALLLEFLGREEGLCRGRGGHMHLFAPDVLAASSGIVGAAGPLAAGFALAAQVLRPGNVAVAFFGEGAMNQGMVLEALNLAVVWRLPVLFVCKDNGWAITTPSASMTGGRLVDRARAFGMPAAEVDGTDVQAVFTAATLALSTCRQGDGPAFVLARCAHLEGHFLGDQLLAVARRPMRSLGPAVVPLTRAALHRHGAGVGERLRALWDILLRGPRAAASIRTAADPVARTRQTLLHDHARLQALEACVATEVQAIVEAACVSRDPSGEPCAA